MSSSIHRYINLRKFKTHALTKLFRRTSFVSFVSIFEKCSVFYIESFRKKYWANCTNNIIISDTLRSKCTYLHIFFVNSKKNIWKCPQFLKYSSWCWRWNCLFQKKNSTSDIVFEVCQFYGNFFLTNVITHCHNRHSKQEIYEINHQFDFK